MIRVMVVDDDFLVRSNIKQLLESIGSETQPKYSLVAEAADGEDALVMIETVKPDIIISDICMPRMDGLMLQSYVAKKAPNIQMIMLSGYDDYDYVRKALKAGAVDYILKHKLNRDVLLDALDMAKAPAKEHNQVDNSSMNNLIVLKRDFLSKLISGCYRTKEEITMRANALELKLSLNNLSVVLFQVQSNKANAIDAYLLEYSILNIVDEILQDAHCGISCHLAGEKYVFLISYGTVYSKKSQHDLYNGICSRIASCLQKYLNVIASFYPGQVIESIVDTPKSYLSAEANYDRRYYAEQQSSTSKVARPFDILAVFDAAREKALFAAVRGNDCNAALAVVSDVFAGLRAERPTAAEVNNVFIDLLSTLNRAWKGRNVDISILYQGDDIRKKLHDFGSASAAEKWFLSLTKQSFEVNGTSISSPNSNYVEQAVSYIHRHYAEDISQSLVAEEIGISPAYLSKLFKEDLDIGFMDFLCNYRIEKAKKLLLKSSLNNKEIARMCGFNDDAYFSRVFKKCTGATPKEYRKEHSGLIK